MGYTVATFEDFNGDGAVDLLDRNILLEHGRHGAGDRQHCVRRRQSRLDDYRGGFVRCGKLLRAWELGTLSLAAMAPCWAWGSAGGRRLASTRLR